MDVPRVPACWVGKKGSVSPSQFQKPKNGRILKGFVKGGVELAETCQRFNGQPNMHDKLNLA
jgi:hypothetical protein